ncbi:heterokaryon incompatibility protein [Hirsutella rhossiliensis]|uniref:Heterokaryon incompatibility protein (HET) domain-containing protein n=1 Tax=Hirsutella rhossiliensis TaxID=111463 RepID=A0A9P8MWW5_9HYPO|nr:heterokaryon incompatibility protein (HET) domain-containing protein [Hirsutella rhossiliensis]KAH0962512.1 heterokaryon incompatibility protein (HET) domain-containing protein [Hirsutella rhossiliensis]
MNNLRRYVYTPLGTGCIRLLQVSAESNTLSGALRTVKIDDAPPYFTLSYSWDSQAPGQLIRVDGQVLSVSPSLAAFVQRLPGLTIDGRRVEWVWIDKICIDQDDLSERSRQVQLMSLIYSRAVRTLIWIGPDLDACSAAWQLVDEIYRVFQTQNPRAKFVADIPFRMYSDQNHAASGLPEWNDGLWRHLRRLFKLPWFTRSWIVQEVALSRGDPVILHGQRRYMWHHLGWASSWLRRNGYLRLEQVPNQIQNVETISNIRRSSAPWCLGALSVATSIKCHATDQRDKIYALIGLAAENQDVSHVPDALRANYKIDVTQVYTKVAIFLLWTYKTLSFLTRANGVSEDVSWAQRKHRLALLPSWVPNWCDFAVAERHVAKSLTWLSHPNDAGAATLRFPDHYNASCGLHAKLYESLDQSVLRLSGLKADIVVNTAVFDDVPQSSEGHGHDSQFLQLWRAALPSLQATKSLADWISCWINATTAEQYRLAGSTPEQILRDGSAFLLELLSSHKHPESSQEIIVQLREFPVGGKPESYTSLASNFCLHRKFIVTAKDRMGIGPDATRAGDQVFVIFGGGVPYIIRKQERGSLFVGESYIHGLMGGEAVQERQRGELVEEILEIR